MPRSLPLTIGMPLRCGFRDCSTEVKKASASMCRIAWGYDVFVMGLFDGIFSRAS